MPVVKLESLQEGMVVTKDVRNMDDMLLIPAGCAITEKHINILGAWGIAEVQVEACEDSEEPADVLEKLPPETLDKIRSELKALFWESPDDDPVPKEVFDLALRRKARQILGA
jgi:hypothetical protein